MHATLRWYSGNQDLADRLAARGDEVRSVIGAISGVRAYYLIRTDGGTVSVTVADDASAAEQSNEVAAAWLRENMPDAASAPQVSTGDVVLTL
jgi:hypothetical protein